jgi:hypothetical protein
MIGTPGLFLVITIFRSSAADPIIPGQWELFGGDVTMWLALGVLILALPIILTGVISDVNAEMEKERQEEEKRRQSKYPFDEDFARAADGIMNS